MTAAVMANQTSCAQIDKIIDISLHNGNLRRRLSVESATLELANSKRRGGSPNCHCRPQEVIKQFEQRISHLEERLCGLCDVVADTKSDIGVATWNSGKKDASASHLCVPGESAPMPCPNLTNIRLLSSDFAQTRAQFHALCEEEVSESARMSLRLPTFNNWLWTEAQLLRFISQMYVDLELTSQLSLDTRLLNLWLIEVFRHYNLVPFHNFKHAFMVTQMMYSMIWQANLALVFNPLELTILITSAICHDLDHPGFNNAYQINAGTQLAMRYNDQSPLENHHTAVAFDIFSRTTDPFTTLDADSRKLLREGIIRCILATDMARHSTLLSQFQTSLPQLKGSHVLAKDQRELIMMILIKVSDISNESRPIDVAAPWIDKLLEEFFHQTDHEKVSNLPVAPFMDREKVTKASSQCGFIRFVILPLFEAIAQLFPALEDVIVIPARQQLDYYAKLAKITIDH